MNKTAVSQIDMRSLLFRFLPVYVFVMSVAAPAFAYHVDPQQITVSGLSSGGYMAEQMQVAYSDIFTGLGVFAAGPYDCALGNLNQALAGCSDASFAPPVLNPVLAETRRFENQGWIAPTSLLKKARIYFYHGKKDPIISLAAAKQSLEFFRNFGVPDLQMQFVDSVESGHGMPTLNYGNTCVTGDAPPYLNNCNYDGAGEMLKQIYGSLQPKTSAVAKNLFSVPQRLTTNKDLELISMGEKAFVYVPTSCQQGKTCRLHVAFHGCRQSIADIQNQFYTQSGYNEWAESNDIIVLYPQATESLMLNNPKGCWDWWGYTGTEFATRKGPQLQVVMNLIKILSSTSYEHTPRTE